MQLFDNYSSQVGVAEVLTDDEVREENTFLSACMSTKLMHEAHRFLVLEGKAPKEKNQFKQMLRDIWFRFYSRTSDRK